MTNKFIRKGDKIHRITGKVGDSTKFLFYKTLLEPMHADLHVVGEEKIDFKRFTIEAFKIPNRGGKSDPANSFWNMALILVAFPNSNPAIFRNNEFLTYNENGELKREKLSAESVAAQIKLNYACYPEEMVDLAVKTVQQHFT